MEWQEAETCAQLYVCVICESMVNINKYVSEIKIYGSIELDYGILIIRGVGGGGGALKPTF